MSFRKRRYSTRRRFGWRKKRTNFSTQGTSHQTRVFRLRSKVLPAFKVTESIPYAQTLSYYWQLTSLPGYSSWLSLWQEFKIHKVLFTVRPIYSKNDVSLIPSNSDQPFPILPPIMAVNVKDQQQFNTLITQTNNQILGSTDYLYRMRNFANVKRFDGNKRFRWSCKPKIMFGAYETGTDWAYVPKRSWVSTSDSATQHFGTIFCADMSTEYYESPVLWKNTENKQWWEISQTIVLKLRKPRDTIVG